MEDESFHAMQGTLPACLHGRDGPGQVPRGHPRAQERVAPNLNDDTHGHDRGPRTRSRRRGFPDYDGEDLESM